ncbi:MAG: beta strand repeat-containing protein, partial [Bdellovibrio sp.]
MKRKLLTLSIYFIAIVTFADATYNVFLNFRYPPYSWIGNGSNSNWSNPDNWSGGVVPGSADTANFIGICYQSVLRCSPIIDTNISIAGINIDANWLATSSITASAGVTIAISGTYSQASNTVDFTNAASVTIGGATTVTGGAMTLSSTTNSLVATTVSGGTLTTKGSSSLGAFSASSGTVNFIGTTNLTSTSAISGATVNANAATVTATGLFTLSSGSYISTTGSGTFNGGITQTGGTFTGGNTVGSTLAVTGATAISGTGSFSTARNTSTFAGNVSFSSSGTLSTLGTTTLSGVSALATSAGTISIGGPLNVGGTWTASGGAVSTTTHTVTTTGLFTLSGGSYTSTSGTNNFNGGFTQGTAAASFAGGTSTNVVGSTGFTFNIGGGLAAGPTFNGGTGSWTIGGPFTLSGTWNVTSCPSAPCFRFSSGDTQISGNINIANITAAGNVSANSGTITLLTTGTQTVTTNTTMFNPNNLVFNFGNITSLNNVAFSGLTAITATGNVTFGAGVGCGLNCRVDSAGTMTLTLQNGNIVATGEGARGGLKMTLTGTASSISANTFLPNGLLLVNKATAGTLVTILGAAQTNVIGAMTINTGTVTMSGDMSVNPGTPAALTINNGGTLLCNTRTLTSTSPLVNSGGILSCTGYGFNWTGLAGDNKWSTPGNWAGGAVPTSTSSVVFDSSQCTGPNCDCTIDVAATALSINLFNSYAGTISLGANTLAIGTGGVNITSGTVSATTGTMTTTGGFLMSGGAWSFGSSGTNTITGAFTQSAGTLNGPTGTGTLAFGNNLDMTGGSFRGLAGNITVAGATSLNSSAGNILFDCTTGSLTFTGAFTQTKGANTNTFGAAGCSSAITFSNTFDMVTGGSNYIGGTGPNIFSGNSFLPNYSAGSTFTPTTGLTTFNTTSAALAIRVSGGTAIAFSNLNLTTAGTTTVTMTGTASVTRNLNIGDSVGVGTFNSGTLTMTGAGSHTVTATGNGYVGTGIISMAPAAGQTKTVTSGGVCPGVQLPALQINGTGAGTVVLSGCVTPMSYSYNTAPGTFTVTGSTLYFQRTGTYTSAVANMVNNVTFTGLNLTHTLAGASSMTVNGTLILDGTGTTTFAGVATINAAGNINVTNLGMPRTAGVNTVINVTGAAAKTITGTASTAGKLPNLTINSAGAVTFTNFLNITGNYIYTTGVISVTGSTLNFATNGAAATITDNGTVSYNNVMFSPTIATTYTLGASNLRANGILTFAQGGGVAATITGGTITSLNGTTLSATTTTYTGTGVVDVTGGNAQTVAGAGTTQTIPRLNLSGSNTLTFTGTTAVAGTVTFAPAAAITVNMATLNSGGLLTFAQGTGAYAVTMTGGTINSRAGTTISATTTNYSGTTVVDVTGATAQTITGGGLGAT